MAIAERYPSVTCSVGTHPHHADEELDITAADLVACTKHPKVVAIGEAGLDYHYDNSSARRAEPRAFARTSRRRANQLPLVIHTREADEDCARILEDEMGKGPFPAVLHCYTGRPELRGAPSRLAAAYRFHRHRDVQEFGRAPRDRQGRAGGPLLIETDAPYLAPLPYRGSAQRAILRRRSRRVLAEVRGTSFEAICLANDGELLPAVLEVPRPAAAAA